MSPRLTLATAGRVLRQIRHDRRTVALLLVVPNVLMGLGAWIFQDSTLPDGTSMFDHIGAPLLGIFPFVIMFLLTSITTLRERQTGTLERLLTMPLAKADFVAGYALAFGFMAAVQASITMAISVWVYGLDVAGSLWLLLAMAVLDALLGSTLGLFVSAFASTEFQAVQFMPAFVLPQFFLCGLLVARDNLPDVLHWISDVLPLSYAVDAMNTITTSSSGAGDVGKDMAVVALFVVASIAAGAATLRRRTP
jgi:ABC-2 type transport system permease protein